MEVDAEPVGGASGVLEGALGGVDLLTVCAGILDVGLAETGEVGNGELSGAGDGAEGGAHRLGAPVRSCALSSGLGGGEASAPSPAR